MLNTRISRRLSLRALVKLAGALSLAQVALYPKRACLQAKGEHPVVNPPRWSLGEKADFPPLRRLDGSEVDWQVYRGKVLIVEFWASWCPFCARQNPLLDRFFRANQHRGLAVVTVSIDKSPDHARQYLARHGYQFECGMLTPAWDAIYKQRKDLPQLFVFDRAGILRQIELREMMEEDVEELARFL